MEGNKVRSWNESEVIDHAPLTFVVELVGREGAIHPDQDTIPMLNSGLVINKDSCRMTLHDKLCKALMSMHI